MCIGKRKLEFRMQLRLEQVIREGLVEKGMFEVKLESMGGVGEEVSRGKVSGRRKSMWKGPEAAVACCLPRTVKALKCS